MLPPLASLLFSRLSGLAATEPTLSCLRFFSHFTQVSPVSHMASTTLVRFLAFLPLSSTLPDPVLVPVPIHVPISATASLCVCVCVCCVCVYICVYRYICIACITCVVIAFSRPGNNLVRLPILSRWSFFSLSPFAPEDDFALARERLGCPVPRQPPPYYPECLFHSSVIS